MATRHATHEDLVALGRMNRFYPVCTHPGCPANHCDVEFRKAYGEHASREAPVYRGHWDANGSEVE